MYQAPPSPAEMIPIIGMLTGVIITGMIVLGPIGRAIGDIARHIVGVRSPRADDPQLTGEVDELRGRLERMDRQMAEMAERLDFSERILAQARKDKALPAGGDVAG
jgi:hypothetical protein